MADTGLDESSCYFYDEETGLIRRTLLSAAKKDWSKRKVVQFTYLAEADVTDVKNGHGTHVCGTVAGSNLGSASEGSLYNGVAPDAQVNHIRCFYITSLFFITHCHIAFSACIHGSSLWQRRAVCAFCQRTIPDATKRRS